MMWLQFLYKRRICNTLALFWYAWAFVAEKAGNYSLADKLFVKVGEKVSPLHRCRPVTRRVLKRCSGLTPL